MALAASPRTDFNFLDLPAPDVSDVKIAELLRLQKFAQRITASLDLDEIVQRITDEVAASLGCVEINIYLHDTSNQEFVVGKLWVLAPRQGSSAEGRYRGNGRACGRDPQNALRTGRIARSVLQSLRA